MLEPQLEWLLCQQEWRITWSQYQLRELCSARWRHDSETVRDVRTHVRFWVTSQANDVENYLDKKLWLVRRFLDCGLLPAPGNCIQADLHTAIHEGGKVIALLSEHEYYDSGQQPWIRHRFKKLVLVERWLTNIIKHLLAYGVTCIGDPVDVDSLCRLAQRHNARTLHAWTKALRTYTEDHPLLARLQMSTEVFGDRHSITRSDDIEEQDTDSGWGTEESDGKGSEWDTEEEWEEGHILKTAVEKDRCDVRNPQISDEERRTYRKVWEDYPKKCWHCREAYDIEYREGYDEEYWEHVYPRIVDSKMDNVSLGHSESKIRRLAKYAGEFIAAVV